jgi:hypothetical protein
MCLCVFVHVYEYGFYVLRVCDMVLVYIFTSYYQLIYICYCRRARIGCLHYSMSKFCCL